MNGLLKRDPVTIIELITAFFLVVGGLYVLSPFLDVTVLLSQAPRVIQSLGSTPALGALGLACIITGAVHIWGILRYNFKVRSAAIFSHVMLRLYVVAATIAAQGVFPLDWMNHLIISCVLYVCYIVVRRKGRQIGAIR